jgi:hypothetical protein
VAPPEHDQDERRHQEVQSAVVVAGDAAERPPDPQQMVESDLGIEVEPGFGPEHIASVHQGRGPTGDGEDATGLVGEVGGDDGRQLEPPAATGPHEPVQDGPAGGKCDRGGHEARRCRQRRPPERPSRGGGSTIHRSEGCNHWAISRGRTRLLRQRQPAGDAGLFPGFPVLTGESPAFMVPPVAGGPIHGWCSPRLAETERTNSSASASAGTVRCTTMGYVLPHADQAGLVR